MEYTFGERLQHAWNALRNRDPTRPTNDIGPSSSYGPHRPRFTRGNEKSIVNSVYNRIAIDGSSLEFGHIRLDDNNRYVDNIQSNLHNCLTVEANKDQTARAFIQDAIMSMLDEGVVAIVPVDTTINPNVTNSYDIVTMRTAKILQWYPSHVQIRLYNDNTGLKEDLNVAKSTIAIVENPLYAIVNEPNSTMQRLIRKLNLLDVIDEQSGSGKLDLLIALPYTVKNESRRLQAEKRRKDIERQLSGSRYGIAYTDATENVTQLNRSIENNLMGQIEYLTSMLYSQLGITQDILDGTADDEAMTNYYSRTIEPILAAIVDEMKRKFLTKTARTQKQSIHFFRDPFKLVPVGRVSEMADRFTRNEILSSNEVRQVIGMKPVDDPRADELRNKNLSAPRDDNPPRASDEDYSKKEAQKNQGGKSKC